MSLLDRCQYYIEIIANPYEEWVATDGRMITRLAFCKTNPDVSSFLQGYVSTEMFDTDLSIGGVSSSFQDFPSKPMTSLTGFKFSISNIWQKFDGSMATDNLFWFLRARGDSLGYPMHLNGRRVRLWVSDSYNPGIRRTPRTSDDLCYSYDGGYSFITTDKKALYAESATLLASLIISEISPGDSETSFTCTEAGEKSILSRNVGSTSEGTAWSPTAYGSFGSESPLFGTTVEDPVSRKRIVVFDSRTISSAGTLSTYDKNNDVLCPVSTENNFALNTFVLEASASEGYLLREKDASDNWDLSAAEFNMVCPTWEEACMKTYTVDDEVVAFHTSSGGEISVETIEGSTIVYVTMERVSSRGWLSSAITTHAKSTNYYPKSDSDSSLNICCSINRIASAIYDCGYLIGDPSLIDPTISTNTAESFNPGDWNIAGHPVLLQKQKTGLIEPYYYADYHSPVKENESGQFVCGLWFQVSNGYSSHISTAYGGCAFAWAFEFPKISANNPVAYPFPGTNPGKSNMKLHIVYSARCLAGSGSGGNGRHTLLRTVTKSNSPLATIIPYTVDAVNTNGPVTSVVPFTLESIDDSDTIVLHFNAPAGSQLCIYEFWIENCYTFDDSKSEQVYCMEAVGRLDDASDPVLSFGSALLDLARNGLPTTALAAMTEDSTWLCAAQWPGNESSTVRDALAQLCSQGGHSLVFHQGNYHVRPWGSGLGSVATVPQDSLSHSDSGIPVCKFKLPDISKVYDSVSINYCYNYGSKVFRHALHCSSTVLSADGDESPTLLFISSADRLAMMSSLANAYSFRGLSNNAFSIDAKHISDKATAEKLLKALVFWLSHPSIQLSFDVRIEEYLSIGLRAGVTFSIGDWQKAPAGAPSMTWMCIGCDIDPETHVVSVDAVEVPSYLL